MPPKYASKSESKSASKSESKQMNKQTNKQPSKPRRLGKLKKLETDDKDDEKDIDADDNDEVDYGVDEHTSKNTGKHNSKHSSKHTGKYIDEEQANEEQADEIDEQADADAEADEMEVDVTDEIPELAATDPVQSLKERYEYKPVLRTEIVFVTPENRITSEILTRFECTEVLSIRSKQIENGGTCYTDVQDLTDPLEMARKELIDKRCPLDVVRMITDKIAESWHINEMAIPSDF